MVPGFVIPVGTRPTSIYRAVGIMHPHDIVTVYRYKIKIGYFLSALFNFTNELIYLYF